MIGVRAVRGSARSRRHTSKPSMSGRLTSRTIRSGLRSRQLQRFAPGRRLDHDEPRRAQDPGGRVALRPVVVHDQDAVRKTIRHRALVARTGRGPPRSAVRGARMNSVGIVTEKVDPSPRTLVTPRRRRARSASLRLSDRPRPVPRSRFWIGASTCTKSWKIAPRCSAAMPMPVSVTAKVTRPSPVQLRGDADFAALRELQRVGDEVAENLRQLLVVRVDRRHAGRLFEDQRHRRSRGRIGLNMPRRAENRSTISNHAGEMVTRPASTLARSSRSSTISVSSATEVWMNATCVLLLVGERPVERGRA